MNHHTILAVNDTPDQLELLAFILSEAGYRVLSAENAAEGLEIARHDFPDLIISDVIMPEMDGIEFCRKIRADKKLRSIPFLLVSALRKDTESIVEGLKAGADDYIELPYQPALLAAKSARLIERKQLDEQLRESQSRLQIIFDNTAVGIALVDSEGYPVQSNAALQKMLGYSSEELGRMTITEFTHPDDALEDMNLMREVFDGKRNFYRMEKRYIKKGGEIIWGNLTASSIPHQNGDARFIIGMAEDITARKYAEQEKAELNAQIERQRRHHENIIANVPGIVWEIWNESDATFQHKEFVSNYVEEMLGYTTQEWLATRGFWLKVIHPEDYQKATQLTDEIFNSNKKITSELRMIAKDGRVIWTETLAQAITNDENKPIGIRGITIDISERRRGEIALRESENRFQYAARATNDALWDWDLITNSVWYGENFYNAFGFSQKPDEQNVNLWYEAIHSNDKERVIKGIHEKIDKGENYWADEYQLRCGDGSDAYVFDRGYVIHDDKGKPVRMIGAVINITDRKLAEQVLQANHARLEKQNTVLNELTKQHKLFHEPLQTAIREITEVTAQTLEIERVGVWLYNNDKSKIKAIDLHETSPNRHSEGFELSKSDYPEYFEALAKGMAIAAHNAHTDSRTAEFTESCLKPLGITSMLDVPIRIGGEVIGVVCHEHIGTPREWKFDEQNFAASMASLVSLLLEANERRQAEEALRESQGHLALAQRVAKIGSFELNLQRRAVTASSEMKSLYGIISSNSLSKFEDWSKYIHPQDAPELEQKLSETLTSGKFSAEFRILREDGTIRWVCGTGKVFYDDNGTPERLVGVNMDITERKQAELALNFQKTLLEAQSEASIDGVLVVAPDGEIISYNQRFAEMWEFLEGVLASKSNEKLLEAVIDKMVDPQQFLETVDYLHRHPFVKDQDEINLKDGRIFKLYSAPVISDEKRHFGRIWSFRDITKRKGIEDAHRESRQQYESLVNSIDGIVWELDIQTFSFTFVSKQAERLLGYPTQRWTDEPNFWANHLHQEDRSRAVDFCLSCAKKLENHQFDYRMIAADGHYVWLRDYVTVDSKDGEPVRLRGIMVDITERKKAEEALRQAETRYRNLVELSPAIVYLAQPIPPYATIYVSPNVEMFGYQSEEWFSRDNMWFSIIHEEDRERVLRVIETATNRNLDTEVEYRIVGRDGEIFWVQDKGCFISNEQGKKIGWQGVILDITETKKLEEQLMQSQKLESVGKLAGGIAHDFNNMLTAINGYSDLTLRRLSSDDPLRCNLEEIKKAGERSAALTHQLLAFSRRQVLQPKVLNLNEVIIATSKMLNRLIGEDIQLDLIPYSKLGLVEADPGQLTQVIMNLAVNARDAMPCGGNITIETSNVHLDHKLVENYFSISAGSYVLLAVSDTGIGINDEIKQQIFEPFFTTKEIGKGTGLGLATVYGIVKQSGGYIWVESEVGKGTTFKIYLPLVSEDGLPVTENKESENIQYGTETILLVEDEEVVRSMTRQMLEGCGYQVIEAQNGAEALSICKSEERKIDLLLTDVVMPKMGGRELAEKISQMHPQISLLYTSGYTDDAIIRQGSITEDMNFIQKPFTFQALSKKVRQSLDIEN